MQMQTLKLLSRHQSRLLKTLDRMFGSKGQIQFYEIFVLAAVIGLDQGKQGLLENTLLYNN